LSSMSPANPASGGALSRSRILEVAVRLADQGGIESLSMRRLARELGVKAMSLYNHVANKDDIIDSIVDRVIGEIEVPSLEVDWKTALRRRAHSAHQVLLRHPWATVTIVSRVNAGPAMLRYANATIGCLREAGFPFEVADRAWRVISRVVDLLLLSHPHSHRSLLDWPAGAGSARLVRRAEELIEARAVEDLRMGDVASALGVSLRTLQRSFLRHRDCSPKRYLSRVRLGRARELLLGGRTNVTSAAMRAGCTHLGQFSGDYRREFGEMPSETLRRARSVSRVLSPTSPRTRCRTPSPTR